MFSRQEVKAAAKSAMKMQRSTAILLQVVFIAISLVFGIILGIAEVTLGEVVYWILYTLWMLVIYVLAIHLIGEHIKISKGVGASVGALFTEFSVNFLRKLGGMLWMSLWVTLWSLLLIIPGIIKSFSYYFTANILADCPHVTARQALKISMRITDGHKMAIFVWSLSWLGWMLLSGLTLGLLWVFYVGPYYFTADAGLYLKLRAQALEKGVITYEELGMTPPPVQ